MKEIINAVYRGRILTFDVYVKADQRYDSLQGSACLVGVDGIPPELPNLEGDIPFTSTAEESQCIFKSDLEKMLAKAERAAISRILDFN